MLEPIANVLKLLAVALGEITEAMDGSIFNIFFGCNSFSGGISRCGKSV